MIFSGEPIMDAQKIFGIHFVSGNRPLDPDKATIFFIHGSGGSHFLWNGQVDALSSKVNTIAIDLPGHGASDGKGFGSVADYAQTVLDFIDATAASDPIPCGLSLGGAIVQQLLIDHPRRFAAGILVGTGARLKVMPAIFEAIEKNDGSFIDMLNQYAFSPQTEIAVKKPMVDDTARCTPEVTYSDFEACNGFDVMGRLTEIQVPVLVVTAEDDKMTPPKYGDFLESGIPNASRAHIAAAGHFVPAEQPVEFNRAVGGFLDTIGR